MAEQVRVADAPAAAVLAPRTASGRRAWWMEWLFQAAIAFKGLDGIVQLLGGLALLIIPSSQQQLAATWLRYVLLRNVDDPNSRFAQWLSRLITDLGGSGSSTHVFAVVYLLAHGLIQIVLVWALFRRILLAYPVAAVAVAGLGIYELVRFFTAHSWLMLPLAVLEAGVCLLIVREYKILRRAKRESDHGAALSGNAATAIRVSGRRR